MSVIGPVLRSVVVVLLLGVSYSKRRCNYMEILSSYREIISVEIQNLNMTGLFETSGERTRCSSGKMQHVLRSIYGITQQFLCQGRPGRLQGDMEKPVEKMEKLIRQNCQDTDWIVRQRSVSCSTEEGTKRNKRRRAKFMRALINCWQIFQSMYKPAT